MTGRQSTRPGPGQLLRRGLGDLRRPSFPVDVPLLPQPSTAGPPDRYPLDLRPMTSAFALDDERLVVTRAPNGELYHNPVSMSLYALGRHTGARRAGWHADTRADRPLDVQALLDQAGWLRAAQDGNGGWRYPVPVPRYGVGPGWYSAMAQGLAVSVMLRGYAVTGEGSFLDACRGATELMLRPLSTGGCSHYDEPGRRPFLEECPSEPAGHILNGAIFALFGLLELGRHLGTVEVAGRAADRIRDSLPGFDLGYWTRYDLRYRAPASLAYHCLHVSLLTAAGRLLADQRWLTTATGWDDYTRGPLRRLRAAVGKGRFVLGERHAGG
ncbi:hypothetical protein DN069_09635 [Streptacidiphilus pinicola]|uniref:D-glucuronyl C5-epimerase C-terminal domain-containing protein n=1 Tax=Streptacidiphilus pinicola TaxID=2219663 RepID=A0A2X0IRC6_9ACTN|nr:D-glucuronyl C5-epimerase family protein [Streptacidiphilus pinicola]RAG85761.1 hypothetical protein DN069_09635 [Streptacidiphilus pinicola]